MTTITLKRPVEHEGKTYATIEVDEPTVGAIEAMERAQAAGATGTGATIAMLAADTGWPAEALRKLRTSDFEAIGAALAPFALEPENGSAGG
ncbi:phage tail assembly protein [Ancylobacter oerskovii]|uniref:Phage tail assembly protein n=1 Tax=Ancylobacter oerskovii TaxID=459519 RepID=A0ABW4Z4E8_9HYPH|nr:phage tail assembly protein [Ancylobacter oerskovii]MBS7545725.1 phage tail assembly protein [Ancylobacter oerskovii]